jgi:hypothetical protein
MTDITARSFLLGPVSKAPQSLTAFLNFCHTHCADDVMSSLYNFSVCTLGRVPGEHSMKIKPARYTIQVFAALLWMLHSEKACTAALGCESKYVRDVFIRHIEADLLCYMHGQRPDGSTNSLEDVRTKQVFRRFDVFVHVAILVLRHL